MFHGKRGKCSEAEEELYKVAEHFLEVRKLISRYVGEKGQGCGEREECK
jgi:hypothetical protein